MGEGSGSATTGFACLVLGSETDGGFDAAEAAVDAAHGAAENRHRDEEVEPEEQCARGDEDVADDRLIDKDAEDKENDPEAGNDARQDDQHGRVALPAAIMPAREVLLRGA